MSAKDGAMIKLIQRSQLPTNPLQLSFVFFSPIFKLHEINYLCKPVVRIVMPATYF